ncbi:MAG: FkbM family methyltransferase [Ruminococcaceae bacterium]|nr:FkbM family methyltransferase [Oscillospiraceae bacterium]
MIINQVLELESYTDSLKQEKRPIFLYGMGDGAEKIFAYLSSHGVEIKGVVASDGFVRGQSFLGFKVRAISEVSAQYGSLCLVLCFGLEGEKSHFLRELSKKHRIVSPNLPVFGEGACDKEFISANADKFRRVYEILADEESKEIYISLLKYNITGDISHIQSNNLWDAPQEFYKHNKRHIDVGAYDGDTVLEYTLHSNEYSDIIAFEPDKTSFGKLIKNTAHLRDITPVNAAVSEKRGTVAFDSGNGRASHCGEGEGTINCESIDSFCGITHIHAKGTDVGSIKIDAEGMDKAVIYGGVNTIYVCKPHISVALYHRAEDYIELPLLLRKHNSNYKFYLRKKEYVPAWDVFLYAIN